MARKTRIHAPGAVYHVILRGNSRQDIFLDDKDRFHFYSVLESSAKRFDHRIHAFCLMTNHVHLEIQVGRILLSRVMQNVSQCYTQWFNSRHNRCGHLFQGRYKAVMVDGDEYLLELAAYIHLNPVRAGIAAEPAAYRWSSHRSYLGRVDLSFVHTDFILSQFSSDARKASRMFATFVAERSADGHRKEFHGEKTVDSRILGDDKFVEVMLGEAEVEPLRKPDVLAVIAAVKTIYGVSGDDLSAQTRQSKLSEARAVAAWATVELSSGTLTELASHLGRDPSTLTCAVRRLERRKDEDHLLAQRMGRLQQELTERFGAANQATKA